MARVKDTISKEFQRQHKLGEVVGGSEGLAYTGGSDSLAYTSVTRFDVGTPLDVVHGKQRAVEVPFKIETYTVTNFLYPPEDGGSYKCKYVGKIVLDADMNVLDFSSR